MIACRSRSSTVSPSDCPFFDSGLLVRVVLDEHLQRVFDAVAGRVERRARRTAAGGRVPCPCSSMRRERHDLGRVQDRRVEAVFERVVQVDAS